MAVFLIGLVFVKTVDTTGTPMLLAVLVTAFGIFLGSIPLAVILMPSGLYIFTTEMGFVFIAPFLFLAGVGISILWDLTSDSLSEIRIWG